MTIIIQVLKKAEAHLLIATKARSYYKGQIEKAKKALIKTYTIDEVLSVPNIDARITSKSNTMTMHYSFDMAQQICTQCSR